MYYCQIAVLFRWWLPVEAFLNARSANGKWKKAWRPLHSMIAITLSNNTAAAWKKNASQAFSYFTQQLVFQLCASSASACLQLDSRAWNASLQPQIKFGRHNNCFHFYIYVHSMHNAWLIVFLTILSDTKQLIQHLLLLETRFATHRWRRTMSFNWMFPHISAI